MKFSLEDVDMWFTTFPAIFAAGKISGPLTAEDTQSVTIVSREQSLSLAFPGKRMRRNPQSTRATTSIQSPTPREDVGGCPLQPFVGGSLTIKLERRHGGNPQREPRPFFFAYQGFTDTSQHTLSFDQRDNSQWFLMNDGQGGRASG